MKILITSDVHGQINDLKDIINRNQDVDLHLNAGDLQLSKEEIDKINMIAVSGNTDYNSHLKNSEIIEVGGIKILLVHGHLQNVKYRLDDLIMFAERKEVNICIFGHTHLKYVKCHNNILYINPGAVYDDVPSYAIYEDGEVKYYNL